MANNKTGLSYYSVDTDRYLDIRIRRLVKDFGCDGIAVYDYLLCNIYRVKGCFAAWDESTAFNVAEYLGLKESAVLEIIRYCGAVGLFNKELLSRGIITSAAIQKRYIDMCTRAKRKDAKIPEFCRIITEESAKVTEESPKTPEVCRKESKVKKSKLNNPPYIPPGENNENNFPESSVKAPQERKEKVAQKRKGPDLSFVEPAFQPVMEDWLTYKSERGQTYQPLGLQRCYARLLTLSGNDAAKARRIVDLSIANNYSGLFPLRDQDNSANRHPATDYHAQPDQTYEDF